MAFESQSLKKKKVTGVFGDVYGTTLLLPKELELIENKPTLSFELRLQVPDIVQACKVSSFSFFSLINFSVWFPRKKIREHGAFCLLTRESYKRKKTHFFLRAI